MKSDVCDNETRRDIFVDIKCLAKILPSSVCVCVWLMFDSQQMHLASTSISWVQSNRITLPQTSIAPENRPSQKTSSLETIDFQVLCWFQGGYDFYIFWLGGISRASWTSLCTTFCGWIWFTLPGCMFSCQQKTMNLKDKRCSTEY